MSGRYVLHHEGTWYYHVAEAGRWPTSGSVLADGEPMQATTLSGGWYSTDHEASVIAVTRTGPAKVLRYELDDPGAASVRYPLTLAPDEYAERRALAIDGHLMPGLYTAVTEPGEPVVTPVEGPWLRLDGQPPAQDDRPWRAALPAELNYHPEYLHLFPGYMIGFRDEMAAMVKKLPGVRYVFDAKQWSTATPYGLEITIEVPFDRPQSRYEPALNQDGSTSRSRKGRTVRVLASRKLVLVVPYRIDGANRAEAAAEWDRREAEILAAIAAASVTACSACMGTGHVISGSEAYEAKS